MSSTTEQDPAPGGQGGPEGAEGDSGWLVGHPMPTEGLGVSAAVGAALGAPQVEQDQEGYPGVEQQQSSAPRAQQEVVGPEEALAGVQVRASAEEDSDIGPTDDEEEGEGLPGRVGEAHQFPAMAVRWAFMAYSVLRLISFRNHVLLPHHGSRVPVGPRPPQGSGPLRAQPPAADGGARAVEGFPGPREPVEQATAAEAPDQAAAQELPD